jgi:hypothetical protein
LETLASASFPEPWKARFLSLEEVLVSGVQIPRCHLQGLGVDLAKPGVDFLGNAFDSQRSERKGISMMVPLPSECRESKVRYPVPWGGKGGNASRVQGLPWGIDTFHCQSEKRMSTSIYAAGLAFSTGEPQAAIAKFLSRSKKTKP